MPMAMSDIAKDQLHFLPLAAVRLAQAAAHPRLVAMAAILALSSLGWLYLGLAHARSGDLFALICRPLASTTSDAAVIFAMWSAMVLAMMLPSAAPMILTYAEIADTAARKRIDVVSPLVLD